MSLADLDRTYVWHPFTPMRAWLDGEPLIIERAEGHELIADDGRRYLDGVSSLWVNVHGHRHPHIDAAIRAQLDKVAHSTLLGLGSAPSILLAEKLVALAPPGLRRVFFSDSGSTAVEIALKIAFQHHQLAGDTQRIRFAALTDAYHGDTLGAVSLGGIDLFHKLFHPLLFHTIRVPPTITDVHRVLHEHGHELAAFVIEPAVQAAAGIRPLPPGLLAAAADACRAHGVLLIADEVATGFGRTGAMFACEHERVTPDLLACAKGLSGGYLPVAATLATEAVFAPFAARQATASREALGGAPTPDSTAAAAATFFHGHSFGGNALGCAAALASLEVFERERTLESLPAKVQALSAWLDEHVRPLPHVAEVRQVGLMVGIDLRRHGREPYPPNVAVGARVCRIVRNHGVILRPLGPVIVLMPPLSMAAHELERLVRATASAIAEGTSDL